MSSPPGRGAIIGEGLVIVVSILLAFLIDAWWERRGEAAVEADYLVRLQADLAQDTATLGYLAEGLAEKQGALGDLRNGDLAGMELARALLQAEQYGWGQFNYNGSTFDDLRNTGNLRLVTDDRLRSALIDYYDTWDLEQGRVASRRSELPEIVFQLLPIEFVDAREAAEGTVDENVALDARRLGDGSFDGLADQVDSDRFRRALQHEVNYAGFTRMALQRMRTKAVDLLSLIR